MADEKVYIDLSSWDEEVEYYRDEKNYVEEELDEETSLSDDDSDWTENDVSDSDLDNHEHDEGAGAERGDDDEDSVVNKVTLLLKAGSDLKALKVTECKTYLRKHGLRLTGTKVVFIERIVEHWRIKDGSGKSIYPRSSFVINCKGDVCKGDIVLFTQKVHDKYDKMKRSGKILGRRTVAGKVIKESYGTAKQQHTFTIEVLWCEGIQKLPPLYPLLVKGRNLYRLMTIRKPWAIEAERLKVLYEKHSRGAAARRVMRERKIKLGYVVKDGRLQKPGKTRKTEKLEHPKRHQENLFERHKTNISPHHSRHQENRFERYRRDISPHHSRHQENRFERYRRDTSPHHSRHQENGFERYRPDISPHHSRHQENLFERYRPDISPNPSLDIPNQNPSHVHKNPTQWKKKSSPRRSHTSHVHVPRPYGRHSNIPPSRRPLLHSHANPTQNQSNQGQPSLNPRAKTSTMPATHEEHDKNHHSHHARDLDHLSEMTINQRADGRTHRENTTCRPHYQ